MNIYVGNLNYQMTEDELKNIFSEYGEVESAKIITDKFTGRAKGFGFVEMPNDDQAKKAIDALNDHEVSGRPMKVNEARPQKPRSNY